MGTEVFDWPSDAVEAPAAAMSRVKITPSV